MDLSCISGLSPNPDISGIGVRLSFYVQTFILVLLVDRQSDTSAVWIFIATSFGLTISAISQNTQGQLSLLQGLQVSNLVWLANFGSFLALASYSRGKSPRRVTWEHQSVRYATLIQTMLSMALTFYMWITSRTFGNEPGCASSIKYVLFVIDLPALGSGRVVGLTVCCLLTVGYLATTAHEMHSYLVHQKTYKDADQQEKRAPPSRTATSMTQATIATIPSQSRQSSIPFSVTFPDSVHKRGQTDDILTSQINSADINNSPPPASAGGRRRPRRRNWFSDFDPMLLGITIFQILVLGYFIVSSELIRVRNPSANQSDSIWGFGQILALIVIAPSFGSLLRAFQKHGFKRRHSRRKIRQRRRLTADVV